MDKKLRKLSEEYSTKKPDVVFCPGCREFFINDILYMGNLVCPDCDRTLARIDKQTLAEIVINKNG